MTCPECAHELERITGLGPTGLEFWLSCSACGFESSHVLESEIYAMLEKRVGKYAKLLKQTKEAKR